MFMQMLNQRLILMGLLTGLLTGANFLFQAFPAETRPLGSPKGNDRAGAVRGACSAVDTKLENRKLVALVDKNDPSLTTQARPTFWVYLPVTRTEEITTAEFELFDENMNSILANDKITVQLPTKAGVARFVLPASEKGLEAGKEYYWVFRVVCDESDRSGNPTVSGWIKRVTPETALMNRLKSMPQADQYKVYAESRIWYDQINLLAQYNTKHRQEWTKLLTAFGLQNFAQQPVIELKLD